MKLILLALLGFQFFGCTRSVEKIIEKSPPENMQESFKSVHDTNQVLVQKDALGKFFLLIPSAFEIGRTSEQADYQPKLVVFEKHGEVVALFEVEADTVYDHFPNRKLLQSFPIREETTDAIQFALGKGLESFKIESPYNDPFKRAVISSQAEDAVESIRFSDSVVKDLNVSSDLMEWTQSVKMNVLRLEKENSILSSNDDQKITDLEVQAEFLFRFEAYRPNADFLKKNAAESSLVGFFTRMINGEKKKDSVSPHIMRWDLARGPIEVLVSENVPAAHLAAVVEGVQYWQKILGPNSIVVTTGVPLSRKPGFRTVSLRWIEWENAGSAYAGMQSDPLTGEIVRGQVFMTSSFGVDRLKTGLPENLSQDRSSIFGSTAACFLSLENLPSSAELTSLSEDKILQVANDEIRMVIAHEMGHVLGLRHNFAGSYKLTQSRDQIKGDYLAGLSENRVFPYPVSTSVMDYIFNYEGMALGSHISANPLTYDVAALKWSQLGESPFLEVDAFCTDEHIALYGAAEITVYGCGRSDLGPPALTAINEIKESLSDFPAKAAEHAAYAISFGAESLEAWLSTSYYVPIYGNRLHEMLGSWKLDGDGASRFVSIPFAKTDVQTSLSSGSWNKSQKSYSSDSSLSLAIKRDLRTALGDRSFWDLFVSQAPVDSSGSLSPDVLASQAEVYFADPKNRVHTASGKTIEFSDVQVSQLKDIIRKNGVLWYLNTMSEIVAKFQPYKDKEVKLPVWENSKSSIKSMKESFEVTSESGYFNSEDYKQFVDKATVLFLSPLAQLSSTDASGRKVVVSQKAISKVAVNFRPALLNIFILENHLSNSAGLKLKEQMISKILADLKEAHRVIVGSDLAEEDPEKLRDLVRDWTAKAFISFQQEVTLVADIEVAKYLRSVKR